MRPISKFGGRGAIALIVMLGTSMLGVPGSSLAFTCDFYVAPDPVGSRTGNGSSASPWDLQTALNQPSAVSNFLAQNPTGPTICLKGGTYGGKYVSQLAGTQAKPITVRSAPGEWAKIDGGRYAMLTAPMDNATRTLQLDNVYGFPEAYNVIINDGAANQESLQLDFVDYANTRFTQVNRNAGVSHQAGERALITGNNLYVVGSYTIFQDLEIMNSYPNRVHAVFNAQNDEKGRGECVAIFGSGGAGTKLVNMVLHDCQEGIFSGIGGVNAEIHGSVFYNNGYIAGGQRNGHGIYMQNNVGSTKRVVDTFVFNNFSLGVQEESQNGNAINIHNEGLVVMDDSVLIGANNGVADNDSVKNSYFYGTVSGGGGSLRLGYSGSNGAAEASGNYFGGQSQIEPTDWSSLIVTGNTFYAPYNGYRSATLKKPAGTTYTWNNNTYYDQTSGGTVFSYNFCNECGFPFDSDMTWSQWRSLSQLDANSIYTQAVAPNKVVVRRNQYDTNRSNVIIYNWSKAPTVTLGSSDIAAAGLANGDTYKLHNVQNYFGDVITGTYNGSGSLAIPMTGRTVAQPIGNAITNTSTFPEFGAFVLVKTSGTSPPPPPPPPSTKFVLGDRVQTTATLNVRASASTSGTLLGTQASGSLGTVIGGPTASGGFNWWQINYDNAPDGWSVEDYLERYAEPPPPPPPPLPPVINSFVVSPASISPGQSAQLSWGVSGGATSLVLNPGNINVTTLGTYTVSPSSTTIYALQAQNSGGAVTATATLAVAAALPPPPPPPPPPGPSTKFFAGQRVQVSTLVNVRATPANAGNLLGTQAVSNQGAVIDGPINADGFNWWHVNYDAAPDGWSIEDYLVEAPVVPPPPPPPPTSGGGGGGGVPPPPVAPPPSSGGGGGGGGGGILPTPPPPATGPLSVVLTLTVPNPQVPELKKLTAAVGGSVQGNINYTFWWDCDSPGTHFPSLIRACGNPSLPARGAKYDNRADTQLDVYHAYKTSAVAKVVVERGSAVVEGRVTVPPLSASLTPPPTAASSSPHAVVPLAGSFTRTLKLGMRGTDVKALQAFLNTHGFQIAATGFGSPGNETDYFGPKMKAALIKFQRAYGIVPASGLFGPLTRVKINSLR